MEQKEEFETISFTLERLWNIHHIPSKCLNSENTVILQMISEQEETSSWNDVSFQEKLLDTLPPPGEIPFLTFDNNHSIYGSFRTQNGFSVLLGPHHFHTTLTKTLESGMEHFCSILSLIFFAITNIPVQEVDIISNVTTYLTEFKKNYSIQSYLLNNTEHEISRFSYEVEQRLMQYITDGNVDAIVHPKLPPNIQRIGKFAKSTFKQYEYMACSAITLSTRAAIQGGLDPLTAYAVSDLAKQQLENCQTINQISALQRSVRIDFAKKVKELKERKRCSSLVERTKVYISNHLNVHFTLQNIADEIGVNSSYLSRRFSQEVGRGIQRYTLYVRIKAACNMLKYSEAQISEIANYLCFPSQSYFCKVFRDMTGCTPSQFRREKKPADF